MGQFVQFLQLFFEAFLAKGMGYLVHTTWFDVYPLAAIRAFDVHELDVFIIGARFLVFFHYIAAGRGELSTVIILGGGEFNLKRPG